MISRLRALSQSSFLRAVAVLSGGQGIAMAVPILAAPILGRLYTPSDYGALAQVMAPAAVLGVVASLQFQHAIIVEKTDRSAAGAVWLCLLSGLGFGLVTALGIALLWWPVLADTGAGSWFLALPVTVAANGILSGGTFWANRYRHYRWIAGVQITNVLCTVSLSILLGLLGWGSNGVLAAYFFGQAVQFGAFAWLLFSHRNALLPRPSTRFLQALIARHWKFPALTMPSEFLGQFNMQIPVFALTALGADATLGAFTRARQLVSMPIRLVGNSVAQVYRREASEIYHRTGDCRPLMQRTALTLLALGAGPCLLFMVFAPWLFTVYLGPSWHEAGELARLLAPMLLLEMTCAPVSSIYYIAGRQSEDFALSVMSAILMTGAVLLTILLTDRAHMIVLAFSIVFAVIYVIYLTRSYILSKRPLS